MAYMQELHVVERIQPNHQLDKSLLVCFAGFQLCIGTAEMPLEPSEMEKKIEGSLHLAGHRHVHMSHDLLKIPHEADRRDIQPDSQELYTGYFVLGTVTPMVKCAYMGCSNDST